MELSEYPALFYLGAWLATIGTIWLLFERAQRIASDELNHSIRRWLRMGVNPSGTRTEASLKRYTEHPKKDRWLRRRGWDVWRFSDDEVFDETFGIRQIVRQIGCYELLDRIDAAGISGFLLFVGPRIPRQNEHLVVVESSLGCNLCPAVKRCRPQLVLG